MKSCTQKSFRVSLVDDDDGIFLGNVGILFEWPKPKKKETLGGE